MFTRMAFTETYDGFHVKFDTIKVVFDVMFLAVTVST